LGWKQAQDVSAFGRLGSGGRLRRVEQDHDLLQTAASCATLDQLWHFNVGSGINAPPMTFEVNGRRRDSIRPESERAQHQLDDARASRDAQSDDAVRFWSLTVNRRKITRWLFWPLNI
jgi:hypothetical protein